MSAESKATDRKELIAALQQIKSIADECLGSLGERSQAGHMKKITTRIVRPSPQIDFEKPARPFVKSYAKGLTGPKKFVLILSWLCKGDLKKEVPLKEIEARWNKMTSLLGMKFNRFFPPQAKDNDWVETKGKGSYKLRPNWNEILRL
jgi:hypothetical protein